MPKTRPLREIINVNPFKAMQDVSAANAPRAVYDMADMAVVVATETMWPSLLHLSRLLRNGFYEQDGWRLRTHVSKRRWNEYFVLEEIGGHGGYLFNMRLRPRKTDEAREALDNIMLPIERSISLIGDHQERDVVQQGAMMTPAEEIAEISDDPAVYLPEDQCNEIEHLVCCAFATDGVSPSDFDDETTTPFELVTTAALGPDPSGHMPGRVFAVRPSFFVGLGEDPDVPVSRSVDDIGASLSVLSRIGSMLPGLGLSFSVRKRTAELGRMSYQHFWPEGRTQLLELAAASVYRDGGIIGSTTTSEILQLWHHACNRIVSGVAIPVSSTIRLLREDGHVDADNPYAAYGDLLHVEETSAYEGVLSVRTSHGAYRIDFTTDDDGMVSELVFSIPDEDGLPPGPEDYGYLGRYRLSPNGIVLSSSVSEAGFFHGNVMRALNDVTASIGMTSESLTEDRNRRYMFAY